MSELVDSNNHNNPSTIIIDNGQSEGLGESSQKETALDKMRSLLGQTFRILISDGRLIEGEFQCLDKDLNFILGGAVEYYGLKDKGNRSIRFSCL